MGLTKQLLLGSAAVLTATAMAQAADLPSRKAAPVQYVKICDAYGAGFFYIPGTDTCLRIGGYVRAEYDFSPGE
ncbi:MAG TPA: porin, partial [Beijerinckiaceae bacterium]|nr:porin [Beijerinckiaceae bacterium]